MRVLIFTFGTRGDIDPFAALAERISASGHVAVFAAPERYRDAVSSGVSFEPMATEMARVMRAGMAELRGPAQGLTLARQMLAGMRASLDEQWDIAQRVQPTLIVAHPKALGGLHIAERLGVPFVPSLPLPFLTPTNAFPIPFLARPLPWRLNRLTYQFNRDYPATAHVTGNWFRETASTGSRREISSSFFRAVGPSSTSVSAAGDSEREPRARSYRAASPPGSWCAP